MDTKSDLVFLKPGTDKHHWMLITLHKPQQLLIWKFQAFYGGLGEGTADVVCQYTNDDIDYVWVFQISPSESISTVDAYDVTYAKSLEVSKS